VGAVISQATRGQSSGRKSLSGKVPAEQYRGLGEGPRNLGRDILYQAGCRGGKITVLHSVANDLLRARNRLIGPGTLARDPGLLFLF
jgi:hypothetical protein